MYVKKNIYRHLSLFNYQSRRLIKDINLPKLREIGRRKEGNIDGKASKLTVFYINST